MHDSTREFPKKIKMTGSDPAQLLYGQNRNGYVTSMPLKKQNLSCPTKHARHLALPNLNGDIIFKLL